MRRILLPALPAAGLLLFGLFPGCGKKSPPDDPPAANLTGAEAAYRHTREILAFGPRPPESAALQKTRQYLVEELKRTGWQSATQSVERQVPDGRKVTFVNLLARFGSAHDPGLWKRPVTGRLAAHLDSTTFPGRRFLGADDAASAVGVILELARDLQSSPELASQLELVFFDGEEAFGSNISPRDGLFGSKAYAARWRTAAQRPRFGIVLDMVGHRDLKIRFPGDTPVHLEKVLLETAAAEGVAKHFSRGTGPIIDDHVPLNDAGIPTIDIIGDFSRFAWWHTESDNLRLISRESLAIILKVTRPMLESLLAPRKAAGG